MKNNQIGIFINERSDVRLLAESIVHALRAKGVQVYMLEEQGEPLGEDIKSLDLNAFLSTIDLLIVIGGDGTFLRAAGVVSGVNIPLLGINKGHLGFLSELEVDDFAVAIDVVLEGHYEIDERMMIRVEVFNSEDRCIVDKIGLNDITLNRHPMDTTIRCEAYLGHQLIDIYLGDGLIVATPTGSTGYSLSTGGPLIYPGTDCFILTPIAPHALGTRPVIIPTDSHINLFLHEPEEPSFLFCDGRLIANLTGGERIKISCADEITHLVHLKPHPFFQTVNNKLRKRCQSQN